VRGAFHCAHLGFGLDGTLEGRGYMREALEAIIAHAFGSMRLHRIEANHQPQNLRSAALLRRLGFVPTGYARDYLLIAGEWRDHVQTALINPSWRRPPA
jgi:ribosomal-protein-alanine N-acetyltransferase